MADAPLYGEAIRRMIPLMAAIRARYNVTLTGLNTVADRVFRMRQVTPNWNSTRCATSSTMRSKRLVLPNDFRVQLSWLSRAAR